VLIVRHGLTVLGIQPSTVGAGDSATIGSACGQSEPDSLPVEAQHGGPADDVRAIGSERARSVETFLTFLVFGPRGLFFGSIYFQLAWASSDGGGSRSCTCSIRIRSAARISGIWIESTGPQDAVVRGFRIGKIGMIVWAPGSFDGLSRSADPLGNADHRRRVRPGSFSPLNAYGFKKTVLDSMRGRDRGSPRPRNWLGYRMAVMGTIIAGGTPSCTGGRTRRTSPARGMETALLRWGRMLAVGLLLAQF